MKLSHFEALFNEAILERGLDYYREGRVNNLEEMDAGLYFATVTGNEMYTVNITLDGRGAILATDCDCPYDWDEHCKHQAAVLFALRERLLEGDETTVEAPPFMVRMQEALSKQTKEVLLDTLLGLIRENLSLGHRLLHQLSGETDAESLTEAMWASIRRAQGASKRCAYASIDEAKSLMEDLLGIAQAEKVPSDAAVLLLQALQGCEAMAEMPFEDADDFAWLAEVAVGHIQALVENCANDGENPTQEALFTAIIDGMQALPFRDWDDRLMACVTPLCALPACRERIASLWEKRLCELESGQEQYMVENIKRQQFSLIQKFGDKQSVEQFIQSNLQFGHFREIAIECAIQRRDYQAALALALDGEKMEGRLPGRHRRWQTYAFEAYKALGDIQNAQKLAYEFLVRGDFDCYAWLKQSYHKAQWTDNLSRLLADLETKQYCSPIYERVLVEEALWDRLMAHAERMPIRIFSLYAHLLPWYPERVDSVFQQAIMEMTERSSDRSAYRALCSRIQDYASACGRPAAEKVVNQFREMYRRRPALLDELSKAFLV